MSRETKLIGDIGTTYPGLSGKTKDDFAHGDAMYITFLNVLNNPVIDTSIFEKVDVKAGEKQNRCRKGDLFFNTSSETPEEVGMCAYLAEEIPSLYLNSFCFGFHIKDADVDGQYLSYYFRGKDGRKLMTMLAQGATRYNLSKENFMASEIELPVKEEQSRIASALFDIDTLIRDLDRTIEKKQNIRQGAMEQLLSGKKRLPGFKGEWEDVELSEFGRMISGVSYKPEQAYNILSSDSTILLRSTNVQEGRIYMGDLIFVHNSCIKDVQIMRHGDILICTANGSRALVGKSALFLQAERCTFGAFMSVFRCYDSQFSSFVYYLFQSRTYRRMLEDILSGSAINNLNASQVEELVFRVPSDTNEIFAIADLLTAMDDEIAMLQLERTKYANIRSGMMDDLLSGTKRL